jgi:small subunit ribosomal protein S16
MLRIRLSRVGKKGSPFYRIVVAEARAPRDGSYLEWIGTYDPMQDPPAITLKQDRAQHWLSKGAQASDPVRRIIEKIGVPEPVSVVADGGEEPASVDAPAEDSEA